MLTQALTDFATEVGNDIKALSPKVGDVRLVHKASMSNDELPCDGRSLAVADYPVLYGLIGNTYGGNSTFFNLPKL
jgi:microcystin-dependent protein